MIDLVGQKFGMLTVTKYAGKPGLKHRWICQCECGNETNIQDNHLKTGNTKSCGCLQRRKGKESPFFKGCGDLPLDYFSVARRNAKGGGKFNRSSKEFSITIQDAWNKFLEQGKKCALTNLDLCFGITQTASLDRIDSSKGYVKGNIQWVHKDVNIMKNDLDTETFVRYCSLVYENQFGRNRQNTVHGP